MVHPLRRAVGGWGDPNAAQHELPPHANGPSAIAAAPWAAAGAGAGGTSTAPGAWGAAAIPPPRRTGALKRDEFPSLAGESDASKAAAGQPPGGAPLPPDDRPGWDADERSLPPAPGKRWCWR